MPLGELITNEEKVAMFKVVDALFRHYAEERLVGKFISFETAYRSLWSLYEHGRIQIVKVGDEGIDIKNCYNRRERRKNAELARLLVKVYKETISLS